MKARTCEIWIGDQLILTASDLEYTETTKVLLGLGGVVMHGTVGEVSIPEKGRMASIKKKMQIKLKGVL